MSFVIKECINYLICYNNSYLRHPGYTGLSAKYPDINCATNEYCTIDKNMTQLCAVKELEEFLMK